MVEFGLKLEDNKVVRWSDHYIDYEKLKAELAKCKAAFAKVDDLIKRKPELAAAILKTKTDPGDGTTVASLATQSTPTYGSTVQEVSNSNRSNEGSNLERVDSKGKLLSLALAQTLRIPEFFIRNYEKSLLEASKDAEVLADEFERLTRENLQHVQKFAKKKLTELEGRVAHLKDSAPTMDVVDAAPVRPSIIAPVTTFWTALTTAVTQGSDTEVSPLISGALQVDEDNDVDSSMKTSIKPESIREAESIQRALEDHYRSAKLLQNFCIMNYTGFVKIIKKHDKVIRSRKGKLAIEPNDLPNEAVDALTSTMEILYANWFCDRNIAEARAQMLTKRGDGLEMDWSQLRLGYRMGMVRAIFHALYRGHFLGVDFCYESYHLQSQASILGLWVCWDCIWGLLTQGISTIGGRSAFPVFRAAGGLLFLQWCWGVSVWIWTRYRINYIYLFDLNPSIVAGPLTIFHEAVNHSLVYVVSMLLYYKAGTHDIPFHFPAGVFPFLLVVYMVFHLMYPWRTRGPMWQNIWHVITSPMSTPTFFHGYVGDIFTSLVKVFQDLAWTFFFVLRGDWLISEDLKASGKHTWSKSLWYTNFLIPLITLLPLWFRFNQCLRRYADSGKRFPHLANAFKYALSQTVTLFGAFHPLYMRNNKESGIFQDFWTLAFVSSSLYSFWWDINMDWGLGHVKHGFLAPRLMFPKRSLYYGIIALDFVLRFAWVLTLLPPKSGAKFALPAYLSLVSMLLEIFRRTIWGFLRLENEHRSNTAGFRRVDFVPLHFRTEHDHSYKNQKERRGSSVLMEVVFITVIVLGAAVVSVVAAQHATERTLGQDSEL